MKSKLHPRSLFLQLAAILFLTLGSFAARADEAVSTGWLSSPHHPPVTARIALTGQTEPQTNTLHAYLDIVLRDGWKTYWRSPGEGGVAPGIDWSGSSNLKNVSWHWPYPQRFDLLGLKTFGYHDEVVIPLSIEAEDLTKPVHLKGTLTVSSCTTVCVLTDYPFELSVNPSDLTVSPDAMFVRAQAMSRVPGAQPQVKVVEANWDSAEQTLAVSLENSRGWSNPDLIIDSSDEALSEYSFKPGQQKSSGNRLTASYKVSTWLGEPELDGKTINITLRDGDTLAEQAIVVSAGAAPASDEQPLPLITVLGFALIGGLILNIMPCVLPVLGMKLSGVISARGLARRQIRLQFIASSLGILASFWLIAGFLLVLKFSGQAVGWGIQFQSGWFIGFMVLVTALFGANMLGLFELRLSSSANTWMASKGDNSYAGHFIQGMFATLLATPCSAPFLGTAVAFALAAGSVELMLIFTALAIGMALPWLLVALFPSLARMLPKPGAWMNRVKLLFGAMMLLTSIWLLSLLANHLPWLWLVVAGLVAVIVMLWRTKQVYGDRVFAISGGVVLLSLVAGLAAGSLTSEHWAKPVNADHSWQPLDNAAIAQAVSDGKTVFVDVTADWCVTCKANKIGVLLQEPVYSALGQQNIVRLKGDWTRPSEKITSYLHEHGRYGVPFNIVYGPAAPQGIPLPVILSSEAVLDALRQASGES